MEKGTYRNHYDTDLFLFLSFLSSSSNFVALLCLFLFMFTQPIITYPLLCGEIIKTEEK